MYMYVLSSLNCLSWLNTSFCRPISIFRDRKVPDPNMCVARPSLDWNDMCLRRRAVIELSWRMHLGLDAIRRIIPLAIVLVSRTPCIVRFKHLHVPALPTSQLICQRRTMSDSAVIEKGKARQPEWAQPQALVEEPVLRVYNSMTRIKVRISSCELPHQDTVLWQFQNDVVNHRTYLSQ
jgi:hypothetical protein